MRSRKLYHRDGERIELVTKLKGGMRVVAQLMGMALILAGLILLRWDPSELHWLPFLAFGVITLPFGWGELAYLISPDGRIRMRARAFGFTIFQSTQHASKFSRGDLERDEDGEYALVFYDAKGERVFTLGGIPDEQLALEIVALVPYADNQQEMAVNRAIDELLENNKELSLGFSVLCYLAMFPAAPLFVYFVGPDGMFWPAMIAGVGCVAAVAYALRRDEGVYRVSREEAYADCWQRMGWFRVVNYRHYLGDFSGKDLRQVRFAPVSLVLPILGVLQAGAIWGAATLHELRALRIEEEYRARDEAIYGKDPKEREQRQQDVQKGIERFHEFKEAQQRKRLEQAEGSGETTDPHVQKALKDLQELEEVLRRQEQEAAPDGGQPEPAQPMSEEEATRKGIELMLEVKRRREEEARKNAEEAGASEP